MVQALAVLLYISFAPAQDGPPPHTCELIEKLRSEKIEDRETAARELRTVGILAVPSLEVAIKEGDLEVSVRAQHLVEAIRSEDAFRRIEEKIGKAGTLSVAFTCTGTLKLDNGNDVAQRCTGTAFLKDGNKLALKCALTWPNGFIETEKTCDGRKLRYSQGNAPTIACPAELRKNVGLALLRAGGLLGFVRGIGGKARRKPVCEDPHLSETLGVTDFGFGPGGKESGVLCYTLTIAGVEKVRMSLWYDPKSLVPLKRTLELPTSRGPCLFTETYDVFTLDTLLPDEVFNLPQGEK